MTVELDQAPRLASPRPGLLPLGRLDRLALALLVLLPLALFTLPSLFGHPPLAGDNLTQNYPLRVLTGQLLRAGHLPLWNPLAFSGTPLLGALNSGSYYPGTWLFVLLPGLVAWVLNLAACYALAGSGAYLLARWLGLRELPSLLGALTYAWTGMMVAQMVHLGVVQGQGLLPWLVLCILILAERLRGLAPESGWSQSLQRSGGPLVALVLLVACVVLTGEPRAIADMIVVGAVTGIYAVVARGAGSAGRRLTVLIAGAACAGWGLALSAAELLVSQHVVAASQRASLSGDFIGSGSLRPVWTSFLAIPDLAGGSGLLHQPSYFIQYNLAEVTGYSGLLALAALFAALGQLFGRRRAAPAWLGLFVALVATGLVLAWGEFTPLFHLFLQLPTLNRTRLQSRNLAIADLGLALLLAWFLDRLLAGDREGASLEGWRRWLTAAPLLATVLLALLALVAPSQVESWLTAGPTAAYLGSYLRPWILVSLLLALAFLALVLAGLRLRPGRRRRVVTILVVVDIVFFLLACASGLVSGGAQVQPSQAEVAPILGTAGRFALVDPSLQNYSDFIALGAPNANVFTELPSVQGYGSLILAGYGAATGAHNQQDLDACQALSGRYRQLELATLAIGSSQLAPMVVSLKGPVVPTPQPSCPVAARRPSSGVRRLYFGQALRLRTIFLALRSPTAAGAVGATPPITLRLLGADGRSVASSSPLTRSATGFTMHLTTATEAVGLELSGQLSSLSVVGSLVTDATGVVWGLDGPWQEVVGTSSWALSSTQANYQVFHTTRALLPWTRLVGAGSGSKVDSSSRAADGSEVDVVELRSAGTLVRSEAAAQGWQAVVTPTKGGPSRIEVVGAHDLVQSLSLGPGRWTVSFRYRPPGLVSGTAVSALAALALALFGSWLLWCRRRRDRRAVQE